MADFRLENIYYRHITILYTKIGIYMCSVYMVLLF